MASSSNSSAGRSSTVSIAIATKVLTEELNRLKRISTSDEEVASVRAYLVECLEVSIHLLNSEHF